MRTEKEIREALRELHGEYCPMEAGGSRGLGEAKALVFALGYQYHSIDVKGEKEGMAYFVDVSEYVEIEE